ncbi:MAG: NUDIX domain-containing protein [Planctomycetota bacterium]
MTGVILHDGAVLMGKRAANVRAYAGLWETAPRGGIEAPHWRTTRLNEDLIKQALRRESSEELGEMGVAVPFRLACIVRDPVASSLDLCYLCTWRKGGKRGQKERSWEYDEVRWMLRRPLLRRKNLSPPTRALWLAAKAHLI